MDFATSLSNLVGFRKKESNKIYLQAFIACEVIVASVAAIVFSQSLFLSIGIGAIAVAGGALSQCALHHYEMKKAVEGAYSYLSSLGGSYLYGLPS